MSMAPGTGALSWDDFGRLAGLKGRFLLSINDTPQVRDIFGRFSMAAAKTSYSISNRTGATFAGELIISNFPWL